jgi:hypothetical protein
LAQVGSVDPASPGFRALLEQCARSAAGLEHEVQRLAQAPAAEREQARARLQRLAQLQALVQDALGHERQGVLELMAQARAAQESLAHAAQLGSTGATCDVRG